MDVDLGSKLVTVGWSSHHDKLVDGLWNSFQKSHAVDFNIQLGDRIIKSHRLLLDLFLSADKLTEASASIQQADSCLDYLLEFLYRGKVTFPEEHLETIFDLAKKSDFQTFVETLNSYSKITDNKSDNDSPNVSNDSEKPATAEPSNNGYANKGSRSVYSAKYLSTSGRNKLRQQAARKATKKKTTTVRRPKAPIGKAAKKSKKQLKSTGNNDIDDEKTSEGNDVSFVPETEMNSDDSNMSNEERPTRTTRSSLAASSGTTTQSQQPGASIRHLQPLISCQECGYKNRSKELMLIHQATHDDTITIYECDVCQKRFSEESRLQRHRSLHNTSTLYRCDLCQYQTSIAYRYRRHMARHFDKKEILSCEVCQKEFTNTVKLNRHRQVHVEKWLRCTVCSYQTLRSDRYKFKVHVASHNPDATLFKCKFCPKRVLDQESLDRHICMRMGGANLHLCPHCPYKTHDRNRHAVHLAAHEKNELHKCRYCSKRFADRATLERHKCMRVGAELYNCPHCTFKTHVAPRFKLHVARHDPTITLYKCAPCERQFLDEAALKRHRCKLSQPDAKPYQCPHCPYTNKFAHQLGYHVTAMHSAVKPYKCEVAGCDYSTGHKTNLRRHVASRHSESKKFVCETCAFRTASRSHLARHQLTHTDERKYKCNECGRAFRDPQTLRHHMAGHAGIDDRTHVCHICGSAFSRRHNLRVHLRNVHKTEMEIGRWTAAPATASTVVDEQPIPVAETM